jgi:hypothetical protein
VTIRPNPKPIPQPRVPKTLKRDSARPWSINGSAGSGACTYCGEWRKLTWDHVLPRSRYAGEDRHTPINLVRACWDCNRDRSFGFKPLWDALSAVTQAFVLSKISALSASSLFDGVPGA